MPTDAVHCEVCESRKDAAVMLLCDTCNRGFHTWCLPTPLAEVPVGHWFCEKHMVSFMHSCIKWVLWYIMDQHLDILLYVRPAGPKCT